MPQYIIIGSNGTLGSEFKKLLPVEEVLLADRPEVDISNFDATRDFLIAHKPSVVINCAAFTNVDGAETDYEAALLVNAEAVKNIAEVCNDISATLIHFSTGMVFDGANAAGYDEKAEPRPVNNYGQSKLEGEKYITAVCENYYIVRTEWLYGKPLNETAKKSFVELMITLGKSGNMVKGVTDEIGQPTWAKDLAEGTIRLLTEAKPRGIYHIANEGQASRLEWAQEIYRILNMHVLTEEVHGSDFPRPATRPHYELLINTKLPPMRPWQDALAEYLET